MLGGEGTGVLRRPMSDLVFMAFYREKKAEEVRDKILAMQNGYLIEVGDAIIATRDEKCAQGGSGGSRGDGAGEGGLTRRRSA
jgi:hypothetical protein